MFNATIHDAAGETYRFLYKTAPVQIESISDTRVVATARITEGRLTGEQVTMIMDTRDFLSGHGKVIGMVEEVDGVPHFSVRFDRALPITAIDNLSGQQAVFHGNGFANYASGGAHGDRFFGGGENDTLDGEAGRDLMMGGDGRDALTGGTGRDRLSGGEGADRFIFNSIRDSRPDARDVIMDFSHADDRIDLRQIDADTTTRVNAFHFIHDDAFDGSAGALRYDDGILAGDTDGDRIADFQIRFMNDPVIGSGDILL